MFMSQIVFQNCKCINCCFNAKDDKDFIVRKVSLANGGSMPNHTNEIQHQQYVLKVKQKL